MPWRCPACRTIVHHFEFEESPRFGVSYRCQVCRLELKLDTRTTELVVAPMREDKPVQKIRETA